MNWENIERPILWITVLLQSDGKYPNENVDTIGRHYIMPTSTVENIQQNVPKKKLKVNI